MTDIKKTDRGFGKLEFVDSHDEMCSLQESSAASEPKIWLGINKPKLVVFEDESRGNYIETEMPKTFMVSARMHLSRQQVSELLPHLQKFVETGEL